MDQRRFVEACSARFFTVTSLDNMAEEIAEAFYAARTGRGPVVLNLPMHLQEDDLDWDYEYRPSTEFLPPRMETPSPDLLAPVIEKLIAAERPVIIAGRGARAANAKEEIVRLADRVGALLATSLQGKGYFAGHPWDIGIAGAFASAPSEQLLADADFVLGVGAELGYYTTEGGLLFPSAEVARIDIKPMPEEIGVIPGLYVQGDGRKAVAAINEALEARQVRKQGFRTAATARRARRAAASVRSAGATASIRARWRARSAQALPKGALFTVGAGHFFSWIGMYTPLPEGVEIQYSVRLRRGRSGHRRGDRHRRRQSRPPAHRRRGRRQPDVQHPGTGNDRPPQDANGAGRVERCRLRRRGAQAGGEGLRRETGAMGIAEFRRAGQGIRRRRRAAEATRPNCAARSPRACARAASI